MVLVAANDNHEGVSSSSALVNTTTNSTPENVGNDNAKERDNVIEYPRGESVPFPYSNPYPQQVALMDALLQGIRPSDIEQIDCVSTTTTTTTSTVPTVDNSTTRILCFESPTGTGKSLSLACASLSWLDYQRKQQQQRHDQLLASSKAGENHGMKGTTTTKWWEEWTPDDNCSGNDGSVNKNKNVKKFHRLDQFESALWTLRKQYQDLPNPKERRENLLRQAVTKEKIQAKRLQRKRKKMAIPLEYEDDDDHDNDHDECNTTTKKGNFRMPTPGSNEWLLMPPVVEDDNKNNSPQIIYAARTHSQLSQFVSEVRKTKWGKTLRVVTLGSRSQGLCGYLSTKNGTNNHHGFSRSESQWTEECSDLRKSKACTYHHKQSIATLALHSLAEPTDMEDFIRMGHASHTCAYYASRQALPHAELVVLPYSMLVCPSTRESVGLHLSQRHVVLIDEAHNLPQAIASIQSCRVSLDTCNEAMGQLQRYTAKYIGQLSARHLQLLGQLKVLLKAFVKALTTTTTTTTTIPTSASTTMTTENIENRGDTLDKDNKKRLLSPSEFLCEYKLDTINLFPIVRYMKDAQLSRKLLGFLNNEDDVVDSNNTPSNNNIDTKKKKKTNISPMSSVETFLHTLNYSNADGKIVLTAGDSIHYAVLNPAVHAEDDLYNKPHAVCLVGGTLQPINVLIQEIIPKLAPEALKAQEYIRRQQHEYDNNNNNQNRSTTMTSSFRKSGDDGSAVYWSATTTTDEAKSTATTAPAIFGAFSCGHVVSSSNVLLQAISEVDGVTVDVRHKTRTTTPIVRAIGIAIERICRTLLNSRHSDRHAGGGVVVFFPSYSYENFLVESWKVSGQWKRFQDIFRRRNGGDARSGGVNVFREPKNSKDIESTLTRYSQAIEGVNNSNETENGSGNGAALLLSVVGGKLSEGINFANDLCRCVIVVGLPYADKSDPLLQEKLKQVSNPSSFYQSLCLRAVNQSVGRAIRHANDYASIVLMDARYPREEGIARGLPRWLTKSTPDWRNAQNTNLDQTLTRMQAFFKNKN